MYFIEVIINNATHLNRFVSVASSPRQLCSNVGVDIADAFSFLDDEKLTGFCNGKSCS